MIGIIYRTTHEPSGRHYVGKHIVRDLKTFDPWYLGNGSWIKRLKSESRKKCYREILRICYSEDELNEMEIKLTAVHRALDKDKGLCMNILDGGDGGWSHMRGKPGYWTDKKMPREYCESLLITRKRERNGFYGRSHTESSREKSRLQMIQNHKDGKLKGDRHWKVREMNHRNFLHKFSHQLLGV